MIRKKKGQFQIYGIVFGFVMLLILAAFLPIFGEFGEDLSVYDKIIFGVVGTVFAAAIIMMILRFSGAQTLE